MEFDSMFHTDSIWAIEPTKSFDTCYTGGRDGSIFHTDLAGDQHTLLYSGNKKPINSLCLDEVNRHLWFTSAADSSINYIDLTKRGVYNSRVGAVDDGEDQTSGNNSVPKKPAGIAANSSGTALSTSLDKATLRSPDYELEGLPWITEYHILKNKRYIITNNSL